MLDQTEGFLFETKSQTAKKQSFKKKFSAKQQEEIAKTVSKYRTQLDKIKPGYPIFEIEGYRFTLGTAKMPGYNAQTMPTDRTSAKIYFDKVDSGNMDLEDMAEELDLSDAFVTDMKYTPPVRLGSPTSQQQLRANVITKLKKEKKDGVIGGRWKKARTQAQKTALINEVLVKRRYRFSFDLSHLIEFIDEIQGEIPAVALALQKIYFGGSVTGVDMSACPEVFKVEQIARKGKKPLTKSEKALIKRFVGPLMKYKTKKSGFSFRMFQLVGIAFWRAAGCRAMIADQQGIGKTAQGMGCLKLALLDKKTNPIPALIVTPRNTLENWKRELQEWAPEVTPIKVTGGDLRNWKKLMPRGAKNPVVITTYTSAAQNVNHLLADNFKFIIMDESQMIRNPEAKRTKALFRLAQKAKMIVLLTGSPIEKDRKDLFAQMRMIAPKTFTSLNSFEGMLKEVEYDPQTGKLGKKLPHTVSLYGGKESITTDYDIWNGRNYIMRPELARSSGEVAEGLRCFMIRRLKNDVLDLPPKSRNVVTLKYSKEMQNYYDELEAQIMQLEAGRVVKRWAESTADKILELRKQGKTKKQAEAVARELMDEDREKVERMTSGKSIGFQVFNALRRQSGIMKVPLVIEWVQDFVRKNPKEPLLIFAEHHNMIDGLKKGISKLTRRDGKKMRKLRVATYTGKTSNAKRDKMVDDFQAGKIDVMIINKAGNKGMNLTRASYVLFAERYWNASDEEQAEDRAHRATSKNPVFIYYFEVEPWKKPGVDEKGKPITIEVEPIDNKLAKIVEKKRREMERFIGNQKYGKLRNQSTKVPKEMAEQLDKALKQNINLVANMQVALQQALKRKKSA